MDEWQKALIKEIKDCIIAVKMELALSCVALGDEKRALLTKKLQEGLNYLKELETGIPVKQ